MKKGKLFDCYLDGLDSIVAMGDFKNSQQAHSHRGALRGNAPGIFHASPKSCREGRAAVGDHMPASLLAGIWNQKPPPQRMLLHKQKCPSMRKKPGYRVDSQTLVGIAFYFRHKN